MGPNRFARRLQALRSERGLSKSGLARSLQISTTAVWNWERGNTRPRPEMAIKIANALGTTVTNLALGNEFANGDDDLPTSATNAYLTKLIQAVREQVAKAAGLEVGQVTITLEYR